jgi:hypothetical protein
LPKQETKSGEKKKPYPTPLPKGEKKKAIFGNWSNSKLICAKKGQKTKKKGEKREITKKLP